MNLEMHFKVNDIKYKDLLEELNKTYVVTYVNIGIGSIYKSSKATKGSFKKMGMAENDFKHLIRTIMEITIKRT